MRDMIWRFTCNLCQTETDDPAKTAEYKVVGPTGTVEYDLCPSCENELATFFAAGVPLKGGERTRHTAPLKVAPVDTVKRRKRAASDGGPTIKDRVLSVVNGASGEVTPDTIEARIDLDRKQINNTLYHLARDGHIDTVSRGVYKAKR